LILAGLLLLAEPAGDQPICTDRPAKANSACTVAPGRVQLETSSVGWSRAANGGTVVETLSVGSSLAKFGLSDRSDIEVGITPFGKITASEAEQRRSLSGFGDVVVRYKHRLSSDGSPVQVALVPFVKLPTARRGIGNRKVEGGLAIPVSLAPPGSMAVTFGPEVDLVANAAGDRRHLALVNLVNLSAPVAARLTLAGEIWTNVNFDPAGTVKQASADGALAYTVSDDLQLDLGANFGLTRDTPDVEVYAGFSIRL
jgi:hypothetical protein